MALKRGVESGFSVVRAAKDVCLYASDDRGRILAVVRNNFATLTAEIPVAHDTTLFLVLGNWIALALLLFALLGLPAISTINKTLEGR